MFGDWAHTLETARESQSGFCLLNHGRCQMSVSVAQCFVSAITRHLLGLPAISPDKGVEPFSQSHQQLGLSTIWSIGFKLLHCAVGNWLKQTLETCCWCCMFYVTPEAADLCRRTVSAACANVQSKNIYLWRYPSFTKFLSVIIYTPRVYRECIIIADWQKHESG